MPNTAHKAENSPFEASDMIEVDAVLDEFKGDHRAAIAALLHDLETLARDAEASTSWGFVRGRVIRFKAKRDVFKG